MTPTREFERKDSLIEKESEAIAYTQQVLNREKGSGPAVGDYVIRKFGKTRCLSVLQLPHLYN